MRSIKSSEHINEKKDGSYHGFGYLSLFSDPWVKLGSVYLLYFTYFRFGEMEPKRNTVILQLSTG